MNKRNMCSGTRNGKKCIEAAHAELGSKKTWTQCLECIREDHAEKMTADAKHILAQRASMAAFKAGR